MSFTRFFAQVAVSSSSQSRIVAATRMDEPEYKALTGAVALVAGHAEHCELADQVTEDDCAVAGHGTCLPDAYRILLSQIQFR